MFNVTLCQVVKLDIPPPLPQLHLIFFFLVIITLNIVQLDLSAALASFSIFKGKIKYAVGVIKYELTNMNQ